MNYGCVSALFVGIIAPSLAGGSVHAELDL